MPVVVKFSFEGDFRRTPIETLSWEQLLAAFQATFPELQHADFQLKYLDDEGDLCHLTAATFQDFAEINESSKSVKVEVAKKALLTEPEPPAEAGLAKELEQAAQELKEAFGEAAGSSSGSTACAAEAPPWASMGVPAGGAGNPLAFLPALLGTFGGGGGLAGLFVQFAPMILMHLQSKRGDVDRAAAEHPEFMRPLLENLREGLEPFPQLQEVQVAVSQVLESEPMQNAGAAIESFLQALMQLPQEEQRDIASIVLGGIMEQLQGMQGVAKAAEAPQGAACGAAGSPFGFPCGGPGQAQDANPFGQGMNPLLALAKGMGKWGGKGKGKGKWGGKGSWGGEEEEQHGWCEEGKGWGKGKWGKKGKGKGKGKGLGKMLGKLFGQGQDWSHGNDDEAEASSPDEGAVKAPQLSFPVEVADGRRLTISWSRGEAADEVARRFAQQHGIQEQELPEIVSFIHAAEQAEAQVSAGDDAPSAPPADEVLFAEQLEALAGMGFVDKDLNIQLLLASNGNMEEVMDKLLYV